MNDDTELQELDGFQAEEPLVEVTGEDIQPEAQEERIIELDGEQIPVEQLRAERMMHRDYTQKTQKLAEEQAKVKELQQAYEEWNDPSKRRAFLKAQAEKDGFALLPANQIPTSLGVSEPDWDELDPDYVKVMKPLHERNMLLEAQLGQVSSTLQRFDQHLSAQQQKEQTALAVRTVAAEIPAKYGVKATAEHVEAAMLSTGINDPEAAFLKAYAPQLFKAQMKRGIQAAQVSKPNSTGSRAAVGTLTEDDLQDADSILRKLQSGEMQLPADGF